MIELFRHKCCPHCGKPTISYWFRLKATTRFFAAKCENCGNRAYFRVPVIADFTMSAVTTLGLIPVFIILLKVGIGASILGCLLLIFLWYLVREIVGQVVPSNKRNEGQA